MGVLLPSTLGLDSALASLLISFQLGSEILNMEGSEGWGSKVWGLQKGVWEIRSEAPGYMETLCPAHSRCSVKRSVILGVMVHNVGASMSLRLSWFI